MPAALAGILDPRSAANQYRSLPIAGYVCKYGFWTCAWALLFHRLPNSKPLSAICRSFGQTTEVYSGVYSIQGIVVISPRPRLIESVPCNCTCPEAVSSSRSR